MKKNFKISIKLFSLLIIFSLFNIYANAQTFKKVVIGGGGHVTAIIAGPNPNSFYAKTDVGGMAKWHEESKSWIPQFDWISEDQKGYLGIESFAVDPQNSNIVYALAGTSYWNADGIKGGTAVLRSDNYGYNYTINNVSNLFRADGNGLNRNFGEALAWLLHN
jgi:hypothetical protein